MSDPKITPLGHVQGQQRPEEVAKHVIMDSNEQARKVEKTEGAAPVAKTMTAKEWIKTNAKLLGERLCMTFENFYFATAQLYVNTAILLGHKRAAYFHDPILDGTHYNKFRVSSYITALKDIQEQGNPDEQNEIPLKASIIFKNPETTDEEKLSVVNIVLEHVKNNASESDDSINEIFQKITEENNKEVFNKLNADDQEVITSYMETYKAHKTNLKTKRILYGLIKKLRKHYDILNQDIFNRDNDIYRSSDDRAKLDQPLSNSTINSLCKQLVDELNEQKIEELKTQNVQHYRDSDDKLSEKLGHPIKILKDVLILEKQKLITQEQYTDIIRALLENYARQTTIDRFPDTKNWPFEKLEKHVLQNYVLNKMEANENDKKNLTEAIERYHEYTASGT